MTETFGSSGNVRSWLPHKRRVWCCRQMRRLVDDHKSGARAAASAEVQAACSAARATALARAKDAVPRLAALRLVAQHNPWVNMGIAAAATAAEPAAF
jgi:hypothetical protein